MPTPLSRHPGWRSSTSQPHDFGEVLGGTPTQRDLHRSPAQQWLEIIEQVGRAIAGVLVIEAFGAGQVRPVVVARLRRSTVEWLHPSRPSADSRRRADDRPPARPPWHQTNSAFASGGMHRNSLNHGLSAFLALGVPVSLEIESTTCNSTNWSASSCRVPHYTALGAGSRPGRSGELRRRRPAFALGWVGLASCGLELLPTPVRRNADEPAHASVTLTSTASTVRSSINLVPKGAASALRRIRAWVSFWAAALPAAIRSCRSGVRRR